MQFCELTPDLLLAFGYFLGDIDLNNNVEIAALTRHARQSAFTQTKPLPTLSACRNFQPDIAFQSWHDQFTAQHCAPRLDFHIVNQIAPFDCKIRVPRQTHAKEKIAAFSSTDASFALTAQTDSLPFMNPPRDLDLVIFHLVRASSAQRDCSSRSVQCFFKRDHDVRFDICATLRCRLTSAKSAESRAAAPATEKCFEEVAESCAIKLELNAAAVAAPLIKSAAGLLSLPLPLRRRLEPARSIPIGAELIIFLALFRVAQRLVGFVDFLK